MKRMSYILSLALCMAMPVIASEDLDLQLPTFDKVQENLSTTAQEAIQMQPLDELLMQEPVVSAAFNDAAIYAEEAADAALKTGWLAWGLSMIPSKAQAGEAVRTIPTHLKAIPSYAKTFGTWFIDYNKMLNGSRLDRASEFGARALIVVAGLATLKKIYSMATAKTEEDEQVPVIFYGD